MASAVSAGNEHMENIPVRHGIFPQHDIHLLRDSGGELMYEELVKSLRACGDALEKAAFADYETCLYKQAADAIEELANKLCDWCGVCPKERRRPWDCEIMWPNAPIPEVYIEPPKEK